jgi:hypothetical protein
MAGENMKIVVNTTSESQLSDTQATKILDYKIWEE